MAHTPSLRAALSLVATTLLAPRVSTLVAADFAVAVPSVANDIVPSVANDIPQVVAPWRATQPTDLHREYGNIFKHGNRNAASHLWARFLLERSEQMTHDRFASMFGGFCAVSGSPVRPSDYSRYKLTLDKVDGSGKVIGFMNYCCWPCVCDTQDFIRVDTRTVRTADGDRSYNFAVIGNPCDNEDALRQPFQDAFGRGMSMLQRDAPEVRCQDGVLLGAPLSDHGYIIINMFFDFPTDATGKPLAIPEVRGQQAGRMTQVGGVSFQDEAEFAGQCEDRKRNGYNSGMGEIFRRVAGISPIKIKHNDTQCGTTGDPDTCQDVNLITS